MEPDHDGFLRSGIERRSKDIDHQAIFALGGPVIAAPTSVSAILGAVGPHPSASRTPVQAAGFTGGMNRFFPWVFAPYGMPLKILISAAEAPRTLP